MACTGVAALVVLVCLAYLRPSYVANDTYLGGLILFEVLMAAVWMYTRVFFPVVVMSFLLAGVDLPLAGIWTVARWIFLGMGALVGLLIILKERGHRFGFFHVVASFAVFAAFMSATDSSYPFVVFEKAFSVFLLFLYCSTGVRIAVIGREVKFFGGLLIGCEIFVCAIAFCYAFGMDVMGNPNSLGAVMGMLCGPILLWGALLGGKPVVKHRRWVLYALCMYLAFHSQARAGWAAALLSCGLLCVALRRYKLAFAGGCILIILVAVTGIFKPEVLSSMASSAIYKGGHQELGLFASRNSPWQIAVNNIREHPWFGMGLGTTRKGPDASQGQGLFASSSLVTAENGSSYLSILSGVGVVGGMPILLLLLLLLRKILQTVKWMWASRSPWHPAVPIAMIVVAGLVHASFEDWMLAPGNYLCVFFWSLAFVLIDVAPSFRFDSTIS